MSPRLRRADCSAPGLTRRRQGKGRAAVPFGDEFLRTVADEATNLSDEMYERQRLLEESEFYPKGNLPPKLRRDLDANAALIDAQTATIATQKADAAQKNAFYDGQIAHLRTLWVPRADPRACVTPQD